MIRFRAGNRQGAGSTPGSYSETIRPLSQIRRASSACAAGIVAVDAAAEHGDGDAAASSAPRCASPSIPRAMPLTTTSPAAASSRAERARDRAAVGRARPRADDRDRRPREQLAPRRAANEERRRRVVDRRRAAAGTPASRRRSRRTHRWHLAGHRYESASARCSGSTSSAPASAAIVRATRATRARPRPESGSRSTALESSSDAASVRRGSAVAEPLACGHDALAHGGRRLAGRRGQLRRTRPRHRDDEVEAVEQRARELLAVGGEPLRRARALDRRIAARAARAQVHRPDELEARREERVPADPRDRDDAVLERLAQRLEDRARELGQLVEQQHAAVRERDLARPRARAAADDRRRRGAVMRRAERRHGDERPPGRAGARDRVDAGHLERLLPRRAAAGAREPPREHRLARSGRPREQEVVRPRCRELERAARPLLAAHVGEIGHGGVLERARRERVERGRRSRRGDTRPPRRDAGPGSARLPASAASGADSAAQTTRWSPARRAPSATASVPATGRTRPSSASSPTAACSASRSGGSCRVAASTASAIGRSKPDPSFRSAAGARLTVIRRFSGQSSEAETTPLRTRCFASWQARSASPTIANPGTPSWR